MLLLLLSLFTSIASAAALTCDKNGVCVGDKTWGYYSSELHPGVVKGVKADGSVNFLADGEREASWISEDRIAITKAGSCSPKDAKVCNGFQSWRGDTDGKVMGYFTTGYVAVAEAKTVKSYASTDFDEFRSQPCAKGKKVCVGDEAFLDDGRGLRLAKVAAIDVANGKVSGGGADGVPLSSVAAIGESSCGVDAKGIELCAGEPVLHNGTIGTLLGAFPDGTLVLGSKDGATRVKGSELTLHHPNEAELHDIAIGLAAIDHINDLLTASKWQDCSGVIPEPGAHALVPGAPVNCQEPQMISKGEDSPNLQKFRKLLSQGSKAPLSSFLMLWYPQNGDGLGLGSPFFKCESDEQGSFNKTGPGCQPDVLYSWGPIAKEKDIMTHLGDGKDWSNGVVTFGEGITAGTIFTSISPSSTFGYGDVLIRIKIKSNAKWKAEDFASEEGVVGVREDNYHDFAVIDPKIIESVSAGTPEIYDELVRDVLHFKSGKRVSTYQTAEGTGIDRLYAQAADNNTMDEDSLKTRLLSLIRAILAGDGKITYSKSSCRNRALTFSTMSPSYVNPLAGPKAPKAPKLKK